MDGYFAISDIENPIVVAIVVQDVLKVAAVSVGDERLSEIVTKDNVNNASHSFSVKFVKDVIEQKYWSGMRSSTFEKLKLSQLQGNGKRLVLPLASFLL